MIDRGPWGVADGWWGVDGSWHETDPDTRATLERAQGAAEHPDGPPEQLVWFVGAGETPPLHGPAEIELDDGEGTVSARGSLPPDLPLREPGSPLRLPGRAPDGTKARFPALGLKAGPHDDRTPRR